MATPTVFQVPPLGQRQWVPMKTIRAIAKHIAEKFDPEEIILFGSHAYGKPTAWSDVDLLVVMETPKRGIGNIARDQEIAPVDDLWIGYSCSFT
jgi:predicted nucleotidyltransferase